ncbi:peroxiredoxin [uncultured Sphingomonas sp.]|uniref:peroxiredoxin n=1 Tax=uncultured Sphingomonas sp. TaxID=158754 RepID=UPI0025E5BF2F|nr:peroxiredoxin [uncultured Sphingomonas sp.]
MTIKVGDTMPAATLARMTADGPEKLDMQSFFTGKRTALFSVPGAFTPTCSARHLPGFIDKAGELKAKGIDQIAAVSVNDVFVMDAWGKSAGAGDAVVMLADGNGDFIRALGLELDATGFGMGMRGQRFAMIVNDNIVEQLFVEEPGQFNVSSADYMLAAI